MAAGTAQMNDWAELGASLRLAELEREEAAIFKAFPALRKERPEVRGTGLAKQRRRMSPASRRAVSARMKTYWAKRKKRESSDDTV
jgi:hypothetical protein